MCKAANNQKEHLRIFKCTMDHEKQERRQHLICWVSQGSPQHPFLWVEEVGTVHPCGTVGAKKNN